MVVTFRESQEDLENFATIKQALGMKANTKVIKLAIKILANMVDSEKKNKM